MKTSTRKVKQVKSKAKKTPVKSAKKTGSSSPIQSKRMESILHLRNLRLQTKEIALNQSNKLQAEISQLIEDIQAVKNVSNGDRSRETLRTLNKILQIVQNLKIKPEKGRFKDFRKIHDTTKILRRLCNMLDQS